MICRKHYAHKGSIIFLNSESDLPTTASHVDLPSSGLLWRGSFMLFLCGSALYRSCAGAGWHGNATKKRRFASRARTLIAHCFVRFASVAALKKTSQYTARAGDQQPKYQAERARCAGYGLVTKFSSKITNSSESKRKRSRKRKLMRSGGIGDEDALNRPFPFTLGVSDPNESNICAV